MDSGGEAKWFGLVKKCGGMGGGEEKGEGVKMQDEGKEGGVDVEKMSDIGMESGEGGEGSVD